jgi:hypothetical protein
MNRKHMEIINSNTFYSKNKYSLNSILLILLLNNLKTTILFFKIDFFFQYFSFRHFVLTTFQSHLL